MTAPVVLFGVWCLSAVAAVALIVGHVIGERRSVSRARAYEADHAAALALLVHDTARECDAFVEDMQRAAVESQWTAYIGSLPVLGHDPERLGGS